MEKQTAHRTEETRFASTVLRQGARRLIAGGIEEGARDAEVLLGHVLGIGRERLVASDKLIDGALLDAYERLLSRRLKREPTAYLTGRREFWSLDFQVTRDVLIPRPETEVLVEIALVLAKGSRCAAPLQIADLGTGSGAIAVALASELTSAEIIATDISAEALAVAQANARRNHVAEKITFARGDLFEALDLDTHVDLMVSNPPYIRRDDIDTLAAEISNWEPRLALDGGGDGLAYYRRIAAGAFRCLAPDGAVAVEVGAGMAKAVAALFEENPECAAAKTYPDYAGLDRVVVVRKVAV